MNGEADFDVRAAVSAGLPEKLHGPGARAALGMKFVPIIMEALCAARSVCGNWQSWLFCHYS
jgi:hypothetical protein